MGVFPLAAAVVAGVFCAALIRQFRVRGRAYQAMWATALAFYSLASLALFAGATFGWNGAYYRVFWLFGAVLNVPFLAAGEAVLLWRRDGLAKIMWVVLGAATVIAAAVIGTAQLAPEALAASFPLGHDVFAAAPIALVLARAYSYSTYAFLLGGALWSAWSMRGKPDLRSRSWGTLLIALGATVVAGGSAFAATGILSGFAITLAAGITLMFLGFVKASGPHSG